MQFIFELLLQPIFEFMFYGIGYGTAWLVVPIFTFGRVVVEPGPARRGQYLMGENLAACIGVLFWILVALGIYLIRRG